MTAKLKKLSQKQMKKARGGYWWNQGAALQLLRSEVEGAAILSVLAGKGFDRGPW